MRIVLLLSFALTAAAAEVQWHHLSSAAGELPVPGSGRVQTGLVLGDFDGDETNDFILSFADSGPALVLYHKGTNWSRIPIELDFLPIAPGGTALDIDRDQDPDVVFGSNTGSELWWWENPSPNFDPNKSWIRRTIRSGGGMTHRGQLAADLLGNGRPQLISWSQEPNAVFHASVPDETRTVTNWNFTRIFTAPEEDAAGPVQSLWAADINLDGAIDLIAGHYWLKRRQGLNFQATHIGTVPGRMITGRFREGTYPQLVVAPLHQRGKVYWYECKADPDKPGSWAGRQLLGYEIAPAGTLAVGDLDQDGNDEILLAERAEQSKTGLPHAPKAWLFSSDGRGNFKSRLFSSGLEMFDAKLVDLDRDGDLDIVSTPNWSDAPRVDIWLNESLRTEPLAVPR